MAPPDTSSSSIGFLWWSARNPPQDPRTSFAGKTVLITGANVGLGYEAFVKFAALGASRIILGMRSLARGETAKAQVCRRTGYDPNNIAMVSPERTCIGCNNSTDLCCSKFMSPATYVRPLQQRCPHAVDQRRSTAWTTGAHPYAI